MLCIPHTGSLVEHDDIGNCWWHPVSEAVKVTWAGDEQMIPIAVLLEAPFPDIASR